VTAFSCYLRSKLWMMFTMQIYLKVIYECHSLKKTDVFKNSGFCFETMCGQKNCAWQRKQWKTSMKHLYNAHPIVQPCLGIFNAYHELQAQTFSTHTEVQEATSRTLSNMSGNSLRTCLRNGRSRKCILHVKSITVKK
jgi:hypothetical protein